jgi:hypothetical protein
MRFIDSALEHAARLPWWLYLTLAGLSYWLPSPLTAILVPEDEGFGSMVDGFGSMLLIKLTTLIATAVLLCAALGSILGRAKRRRLSQRDYPR